MLFLFRTRAYDTFRPNIYFRFSFDFLFHIPCLFSYSFSVLRSEWSWQKLLFLITTCSHKNRDLTLIHFVGDFFVYFFLSCFFLAALFFFRNLRSLLFRL